MFIKLIIILIILIFILQNLNFILIFQTFKKIHLFYFIKLTSKWSLLSKYQNFTENAKAKIAVRNQMEIFHIDLIIFILPFIYFI
jgi:hypothetical protein